MADVFKALADSNRRKILNLLKEKDLNVGEIAVHFEITNASLSHHLNILHEAELVNRVKKGQFVFYSLNVTIIQDIISGLLSLQKKEE